MGREGNQIIKYLVGAVGIEHDPIFLSPAI
jgi:hypothetical protein